MIDSANKTILPPCLPAEGIELHRFPNEEDITMPLAQASSKADSAYHRLASDAVSRHILLMVTAVFGNSIVQG